MRFIRKCWNFLGLIMGEGEYARYCSHLRNRHPERKLPSPEEFYVARLNEKYSRPNRCV